MNNNKLFINNRKRFVDKMKDNSIAIFISNYPTPSNGDAYYKFIQNTNLLWVCGINQPNTFVVIIKKNNKEIKDYLFITKSNPLKEIWDGKFLTIKQAEEISGIENIYFNDSFDYFLQFNICNLENIYLSTNENDRKNGYFNSEEYKFIDKIKKEYPLHNLERSATILKYLRSIKNEFEIKLIQKSIDITEQTFNNLLKIIKPNIYENEIQAEIIYNFLKLQSSGYAFEPIIASGDNARILHYVENNNICKDNEMVLIDFGASYKNYNADITRTIPINGKFNNRQKSIYNACLNLNKYAESILKPKVLLSEYTEVIGKEATKEFLKLGLINKEEIKNQDPLNPAYRKYLYHGISHHLGLDVHDIANKNLPIEAGMVLTIEPGIYIEQENIGIRLENDVLITKNGCKNLSKNIIIETDDIENLMKK